jgi:hypothetical protein
MGTYRTLKQAILKYQTNGVPAGSLVQVLPLDDAELVKLWPNAKSNPASNQVPIRIPGGSRVMIVHKSQIKLKDGLD